MTNAEHAKAVFTELTQGGADLAHATEVYISILKGEDNQEEVSK